MNVRTEPHTSTEASYAKAALADAWRKLFQEESDEHERESIWSYRAQETLAEFSGKGDCKNLLFIHVDEYNRVLYAKNGGAYWDEPEIPPFNPKLLIFPEGAKAKYYDRNGTELKVGDWVQRRSPNSEFWKNNILRITGFHDSNFLVGEITGYIPTEFVKVTPEILKELGLIP